MPKANGSSGNGRRPITSEIVGNVAMAVLRAETALVNSLCVSFGRRGMMAVRSGAVVLLPVAGVAC